MSYVDNIMLFNILRLRYWQMLNIKEECHGFYTSALERTTAYVKKQTQNLMLPQVTSPENGKNNWVLEYKRIELTSLPLQPAPHP